MEPANHRRKNSGLNIAQWCDQNGLTKNTYHYWQKRVRTAALNAAGTDIAVSTPSDANPLIMQSNASPAFAELSQPSDMTTYGTTKVAEKNTTGICAPVTIQSALTMISITYDADNCLLNFVSEVIRNVE